MLSDEEMKRTIVKDAQMGVLEELQSGKNLDWLSKAVLDSMVNGRIEMSDEVESLLRELQLSGVIR